MAQGKIKVKTNQKPPSKKNKPTKNKGGVKKGKFTFSSKKAGQAQIQKFKKSIQKEINAKIESDLKAVALKQDEGKAFKTLSQPSTSKK